MKIKTKIIILTIMTLISLGLLFYAIFRPYKELDTRYKGVNTLTEKELTKLPVLLLKDE